MTKPRLLDLYCGAGGAAMGYSQAGFEVVGVDIKPQKHYPFCFVLGDALEVMERLIAGGFIECQHGDRFSLSDFAVIHASPPCQGYSIMRNLPWLKDKVYPLLIDPTRELLEATGLPWVIENVMGAHLPAGWLCGTMFGLPFYRHRAFEASFYWMAPGHPTHSIVLQPRSSIGGRARNIVDPKARTQALRLESKQPTMEWGLPRIIGKIGTGHTAGVNLVRWAMGIDWMNRHELTQAIPPAYTKYIGEQWMLYLRG